MLFRSGLAAVVAPVRRSTPPGRGGAAGAAAARAAQRGLLARARPPATVIAAPAGARACSAPFSGQPSMPSPRGRGKVPHSTPLAPAPWKFAALGAARFQRNAAPFRALEVGRVGGSEAPERCRRTSRVWTFAAPARAARPARMDVRRADQSRAPGTHGRSPHRPEPRTRRGRPGPDRAARPRTTEPGGVPPHRARYRSFTLAWRSGSPSRRAVVLQAGRRRGGRVPQRYSGSTLNSRISPMMTTMARLIGARNTPLKILLSNFRCM